MEDIRIQKLENQDPRLLIASFAEPSHQAKPVFTCQFLFGNPLGHIQEFLRDEALDLAERRLLKDPAYLFALAGLALEENQFTNFAKQRPRRISHFLPQRFVALQLRQL